MAYSELIKNFDRIRDYLRDFFVYGFKNRGEYDVNSARSYDNERRRIESWLGGYMSFHREASKKSVFISIDSRAIRRNPLYNAFKAKTFTANDVTLHFIVLDILAGGDSLSTREILEKIDAEYLSAVDTRLEFDESTIRKKLAEYVKLGLLCSVRSGKTVLYRRSDDWVNLNGWRDAVAFFSEIDPIGVIGSFLLDKFESSPDYFGFKHHYILHAMESEVLCDLLGVIAEHSRAELRVFSSRYGKPSSHNVFPLKICISVQNARRYLWAYNYRFKRIVFYRLDSIRDVTAKEYEPDFEKYRSNAESFKKTLWGVAIPKKRALDHIEMDIRVEKGERYIWERLEREKRNGKIEAVNEDTYRFTAEVRDAAELLPWIRTFIGRIVDFRSSNEHAKKTFRDDLKAMEQMYGVADDAVL
jgi:DNA-binding transcriptional ArsR family regulator